MFRNGFMLELNTIVGKLNNCENINILEEAVAPKVDKTWDKSSIHLNRNIISRDSITLHTFRKPWLSKHYMRLNNTRFKNWMMTHNRKYWTNCM